MSEMAGPVSTIERSTAILLSGEQLSSIACPLMVCHASTGPSQFGTAPSVPLPTVTRIRTGNSAMERSASIEPSATITPLCMITTRSVRSSSSVRAWDDSSTVAPAFRSSSTIS